MKKKINIDNDNQIKKSNSFSSIKIHNNNNFNSTFTEFPKKNNLLINPNNYFNKNNIRQFNSTLTEWTKNNMNNLNNMQGINGNNANNNHFATQENIKNPPINLSAPSLHNINNNNNNKKSLILDLDETLVHSSFFPFDRASDLTLPIKVDNKKKLVYILRRPYAIEFMKEMSLYYDIIIYTASISEYASYLLDELDKYKIITKRFYRNNCLLNNGMYIKDLRIIGKPLKDLIIIDNNPISYINNINNGLPILSWYGDAQDIELLKLIPLLKYLANVEDVTSIIPQIVNRKKNKIKYSLINKMINNADSNLNLFSITNFGGENKKINENQNNGNNIKKNNDNGAVINNINNNNTNYVNNNPNAHLFNNNKNHNLKNINNSINYGPNMNYNNNNEAKQNSINGNNENNCSHNFNESSELRDSVFSPEEPMNFNNIEDLINEEQKNNNINYEYLNRTPLIEKRNNKSYTPDSGIHRMAPSKCQENGCILNKFNKIEENFKLKTNNIELKNNNQNKNNNNNNQYFCNKNNCNFSHCNNNNIYCNNNEINKATPYTILNNSMKNNIIKYFIPNLNNNIEGNNNFGKLKENKNN